MLFYFEKKVLTTCHAWYYYISKSIAYIEYLEVIFIIYGIPSFIVTIPFRPTLKSTITSKDIEGLSSQ
jgi:hypothetical protein